MNRGREAEGQKSFAQVRTSQLEAVDRQTAEQTLSNREEQVFSL